MVTGKNQDTMEDKLKKLEEKTQMDPVLEQEVNMLSMADLTRILMGVPDVSQINLAQFRALRDMAQDPKAIGGMENLVVQESDRSNKARVQTPADAMPAPTTELKR